MILHRERRRPVAWKVRSESIASGWLTPFVALEWVWEWVAFALSSWTFIEVLEYLETFSVLVAVVFYFAESGDRLKQRHYQAWQVVNTAQGKGGSGGRIEALQELNEDRVPLVGVDASSAYLQGLNLEGAKLVRSDFSSADLRKSNFKGVDFTQANLDSANLRGAALDRAWCEQTDLRNADLNGSSLVRVDFSGTSLDEADMRGADLREAQWQHLKSIQGANIAGVRNAPKGFVEWALKNGAVDQPGAEQ